MKNSITAIATKIKNTNISITPERFLNIFLFCLLSAFFAACGSNAADYADEYQYRGKTISEIDSIKAAQNNLPPLPETPKHVSPAEKPLPTLRQVVDTAVVVKDVTQMAQETAANAEAETAKAIAEAEQRLADLRAGKTPAKLPLTPGIPGEDNLKSKPKSPATPAYKCECLDVHVVIKNTTPSGVVAYYKGKYPGLTLKELERINQPGILGVSKFRPGLKVCLKRKSA